MTRRSAGRPTRQILSGSSLAPPGATIGGKSTNAPNSFVLKYFIGLAVLVIATALVWALWGMLAASAILFGLSIGLIASWLVL